MPTKNKGKSGKPKNYTYNGAIVFQTGKITDKIDGKKYRFFNDPKAGVEVKDKGDYEFLLVEIENTYFADSYDRWHKILNKLEKFVEQDKGKKLKKLVKKISKKRGERVAVDLEED